jgi:hypothetical protein
MYHLFFAPSVFLLELDLGLGGGFRRILGLAWGCREAVGRCMVFGMGLGEDIDIDRLVGRCK